jgi:hypothetical protein
MGHDGYRPCSAAPAVIMARAVTALMSRDVERPLHMQQRSRSMAYDSDSRLGFRLAGDTGGGAKHRDVGIEKSQTRHGAGGGRGWRPSPRPESLDRWRRDRAAMTDHLPGRAGTGVVPAQPA